jgi:hypothetical protein
LAEAFEKRECKFADRAGDFEKSQNDGAFFEGAGE